LKVSLVVCVIVCGFVFVVFVHLSVRFGLSCVSKDSSVRFVLELYLIGSFNVCWECLYSFVYCECLYWECFRIYPYEQNLNKNKVRCHDRNED